MPRPKLLDRPQQICIQLPESLLLRVRLELFSELENRVPLGAQSKLIQLLLENWLNERTPINGK